MSIDAYLGKKPHPSRLKSGLGLGTVKGQVLEGQTSVEQAFANSTRLTPPSEAYETIQQYDAVLRAHLTHAGQPGSR